MSNKKGWLSEEEYRAYKRSKSARKRGVRANARDRAQAELRKSEQVAPREGNPIKHSSPDDPKPRRVRKTFPVTVRTVDGQVRVVSDQEVRRTKIPRWVEKSKESSWRSQ